MTATNMASFAPGERTRAAAASPDAALARHGKNPYVHGLRGLLALGVLLFHVVNSGLPTFHGRVIDWANEGLLSLSHCVELFFGISGIVIVGAFCRAHTPLAFLEDRIFRIFPLLWVCVCVILTSSQFAEGHHAPVGPWVLIGNLLALPNIVPMTLIHPAAWTLSYEFAFYASFVVFGLLRPRVGRGLAAGAFALLLLALIVSHLRATAFVLGASIALLARSHRGGRAFGYARYPGWCLLLALLAWHCGYRALGLERTLPELSLVRLLQSSQATAWFALATAAAWYGLAGVVDGAGRFGRLLATPAVQWLGTISFSLYMWQTIAAAAIKQAMRMAHLPELLGGWSQVCFLAVLLLATLVLAHGSQIYIEGHATRWLRNALHSTALGYAVR